MTETNSKIVKAIAARKQNGRLPCVAAEEIAGRFSVPLKAVGQALDDEGIKITDCQLGLFGVPPKKKDDLPPRPEVLNRLRKQTSEKSLPCAQTWNIARELSVPRAEVGAACEAEGIKITHCQLGAF